MTPAETGQDSPVGALLLAGVVSRVPASRRTSSASRAETRPSARETDRRHDDGAFDVLRNWLDACFAQATRSVDLALAPKGMDVQKPVRACLATLPFGETSGSDGITRTTGRPGSARAVGAASGANPLPIVLPCHRAIGADGAAPGGGIGRKASLLSLGGVRSRRRPAPPPADH